MLKNLRVAVVPYNKGHLKNKLFDLHELSREIKNIFINYNVQIDTYDLLEIADVLIIFNRYFFPLKVLIYFLSKNKDLKVYYIQTETPMVLPINNEFLVRNTANSFSGIFTFNDRLKDLKNVIKIRIGNALDGEYKNSVVEKKNAVVMVQSNKKSNHKNELYSKRIEIINYFEANGQFPFDLFGYGFRGNTPNYRGVVEDKHNLLSQYKFAFAIENSKNFPGYISEKLFDCYYCNTIPIYYSEDINQLRINQINLKSLINYCDFKSMDDLVSYLKSLTKDEYMNYLIEINKFKDSTEYKKYGYKYNAKIIANTILKNRKEKNNSFYRFFRVIVYLAIFNLYLLFIKIILFIKRAITLTADN